MLIWGWKKLSRRMLSAFVTLVLVLPLPLLFAQNQNMGEIRGTITDTSGARVAGAYVTVTNTQTGVVTKNVADSTGTYDVPMLAPGNYTIEFSKEGFKKYVRQGITLHVEIVTINAVLVVGTTDETVTVTEDVPLIQTENAERSVVISEKTMNELPNVGRAWWDLTMQLPGVNPGGNSSGAGQDASGAGFGVNGNPGYMENFVTDGSVTTLPVSQNPGNMVPLDDIAEVDMKTSNFGAEYGGGVAALNVITKSGSNKFHGSLYDFEQNNALGEATNYFATSAEPLRWHMFGGTLGGPIRRKKIFFFFSVQDNPNITYSPSFYTFPTPAMTQGDFSAFLGASENLINPCNGQEMIYGQIYDPATTQTVTYQGQQVTCRMPFANNQIPTTRFDSVAAKVQAYFPSVPNASGIPSNNYYWNTITTNTSVSYNFKVDYDITASNRLSGSAMFNAGSSYAPGPVCPISTSGGSCSSQTGLTSQAQITDVWTISPKLLNEARVGYVRQFGLWDPPDAGAGYPEKLGLGNAISNVFPNISMDGAGGTSLKTGLSAKLGFTSYMYSDTVTWSKGQHTLKFGGEFDRWQDNQAWANLDAGDWDFAGGYTINPMDPNPQAVGYADFLLGVPDSWGVAAAPETGNRTWNLQAFANDDYKITPHLTVNVGVRWMMQAGWHEIENRVANFDPNLYNSGYNPLDGQYDYTPGYGATCYAGVTFSQNGTNYTCPSAEQKTVKDIFEPRVGFAWSPTEKWSVRAGYGIFSEMWGANNYVNTFAPGWEIQGGVSTPNNVLTPIGFSLSQGPPSSDIEYPGPADRQPWSLNGTGTSYIPYDTPAAYVEQYSLDIQHQIGHLGLDAAYVGSKGIHLLFSRNIDQTPAAYLGTGLGLPYPQYPDGGVPAGLYDGISFYNSLQMSAQMKTTRDLSFRVNYTFSKSMDEFTSPGSCCTSDVGNYQNAYNPRSMYAVSGYDVPQMWTGMAVYGLPFGAGKRLLNEGGLVNALAGGWTLSGVFQIHTGVPFTPLMATNLSGARNGGAWWPDRVCNGKLSAPTIQMWFNTACFAQPAIDTYGDSSRDILRGPDWRNVNLSASKHFPIKKLGEGGQLEMKVDAFDVANHPNFGTPNVSIGSGSEGVITSANTNRNLQVGAKLSF